MISLLIYSVISFAVSDCDKLDDIRHDYHQVNSEMSLNTFLENYQDDPCAQSIPYIASVIMQQAEYAKWPHKKLEYFNEGKKMLEGYIAAHPNNIEAHYVRLLVQSSVPGILGYKKEMGNDKVLILTEIEDADLPEEYKLIIIENTKKIDL